MPLCATVPKAKEDAGWGLLTSNDSFLRLNGHFKPMSRL